MLTTAIYTRAAVPNDRRKLESLLRDTHQSHNHLDWNPPYDWLGKHPFQLAFMGEALIGAFAAPPDLPGVAWIRLAAVADGYPPNDVLDTLWSASQDAFYELTTRHVNCMVMEQWMLSYLERWGFSPLTKVVVLKRIHGAALPAPTPFSTQTVEIRPARATDLNAITSVDNAAFEAPWQYSRAVIQQAISQCSRATVAVLNDQIAGYEISSGGRHGGHLARLAVMPGLQGRGVGRLLVRRMIEHFERKGALAVTVNTQMDNAASLAVYRAAGFELTNETYAVWQYRFNTSATRPSVF
jgi:ribosomal protein S18 acetylase RimI-like enzyme